MRIVTTSIARPLEACWRAFTEPASMPRWVPGLRTATVVDLVVDELPAKIAFEYAVGLRYTLRYTYDLDAHVVRWEPLGDEGGGVRGFARFTVIDGGTQLTYALEHDVGRKAAERALDDPNMLAEAFARFMHEDR